MNLMIIEKHYTTANDYYKQKYAEKVFKLSLNGDFTYLNRDGLCGFGWCTFCIPLVSGKFAGNKSSTIKTNSIVKKRCCPINGVVVKYIIYFQANTNN